MDQLAGLHVHSPTELNDESYQHVLWCPLLSMPLPVVPYLLC